MQSRRSKRLKAKQGKKEEFSRQKSKVELTDLTSTLPPEILSLIFVHCLPSQLSPTYVYPGRMIRAGPRYLAAVCAHWRQIALSTPQLWTNVGFDFAKVWHSEATKLSIEQLSRSGSLPLSMTTTCSHSTVVSNPRIGPLLDELASFATRFTEIDISFTRHNFPYFRGFLKGLAAARLLRKLFLYNSSAYEMKYRVSLEGGSSVALPSYVHLCGLSPSGISISWNKVTSLIIEQCYLDECFEVLRNAHKLVECSFEIFRKQDAMFQFPLPTTKIVHTNIKAFHLSAHLVPVNTFFNKISFPSLISLHISTNSEALLLSELQPFISLSKCRISDLFLETAKIACGDMINLLSMIPSLRTLALRAEEKEIYYFDPEFLVKLSSTAGFLPNLENLYYQGWVPFQWQHLSAVFCPSILCDPPKIPTSKESDRLRPLRNMTVVCDGLYIGGGYPDDDDVEQMEKVAELGYGLCVCEDKKVMGGDASARFNPAWMFPFAIKYDDE